MKKIVLLITLTLVLVVACAPTAPATPVAPPPNQRAWIAGPTTEQFLQVEVKSQRGEVWQIIVLNPEIDSLGLKKITDSKPSEFEGFKYTKSVEFKKQLNAIIKASPPTVATSENSGVEVYVSPKNRVVMVLLPGLTEFYTANGLPTTDQVMIGFRGEIRGLISVAKLSDSETILYIETD